MKRLQLCVLLGLMAGVWLMVACISAETPIPTATATSLPDPTPVPATPTATAIAPTPTAVVSAETETETETETDLPEVRIRNAATDGYLADDDGQAVVGDDHGDASVWRLEPYQGTTRLQNRASGHYLSIENLQPHAEVLAIESEWRSPRWLLEATSAESTVILRNEWHNWQILYVSEDGVVAYDRVPETDATAHWVIEPLDASQPLAVVPTPAPAQIPPAPNPIDSRGAAVPWIEYEAELGETNGEILGPDRTFGTIASESSRREAVRLDAVGEYVSFVATEAANSAVVRYVLPDSEDGTGLDATISLYVDGAFRQKIPLTSKYAWSYGGEEWTFNTPAAGGAHHFYDEARALVGDIPAGATVTLQLDADDSAEYVVVDLVDLEQVAPPKAQPDGSLSIVEDCGAMADDGEDDGDAIRSCIARARDGEGNGVVWMPPGTYDSTASGFDVADVAIHGAGMWHTTVQGAYARFNCVGDNCRYHDFAILGETILRDDSIPENGFNGGAGSGSRLENIWVEHTKVGYWVGGPSNGLVITGSRFRNLFADGVNFCNGTSYSVIENSHFRNTGDDALASWSPEATGVNRGNVFRFNTVQVPWRANCFAIYGGENNAIENNVCADVVTYPGILIAQQFNSNPFGGTTTVQRNDILRAGGRMFNDNHGALKVWADQGEIPNLLVRDVVIDGSTFMGLELDGPYPIVSAEFDQLAILNSGTAGIYFSSNLAGDATFTDVVIADSGTEPVTNYAPVLQFEIVAEESIQGWPNR